MDDITEKTDSSRHRLEDKKSLLSRKVWDLENRKYEAKLNADGSVPLEVMRKIVPNIPYITNYRDGSNNAISIIKINNVIYKILNQPI